MPNWCENRITIDGEPDEIAKVKKAIRNKKGVVSFEGITPMPEILRRLCRGFRTIDGVEYRIWIDDGDGDRALTEAEQAEVDATGYPDWYEWANANWGTKWDLKLDHIHEDDDHIEIRFDTAWGPPEPWIRKLREKFPEVRVTAFFDEPGVQAAGYL